MRMVRGVGNSFRATTRDGTLGTSIRDAQTAKLNRPMVRVFGCGHACLLLSNDVCNHAYCRFSNPASLRLLNGVLVCAIFETRDGKAAKMTEVAHFEGAHLELENH
jgi:hypothetical protein